MSTSVCVQVHAYVHVCARTKEDRGIYHLNRASLGDESKPKFRFKSHHGQEGSPRLT